jgi:hypothetical protein
VLGINDPLGAAYHPGGRNANRPAPLGKMTNSPRDIDNVSDLLSTNRLEDGLKLVLDIPPAEAVVAMEEARGNRVGNRVRLSIIANRSPPPGITSQKSTMSKCVKSQYVISLECLHDI